MKNLFKITILISFLILLVSCGTPLSPKRSESEQKQFKQLLLQSLEKEYSQPFKILDFKYEYKTHYPNGACNDCRVVKYGTFYFKIKSLANDIIIIDSVIYDNKKESIKTLIDSFKKSRLKTIYCGSFGNYWDKHSDDKNNKALEKTMKYCNDRGQEKAYNVLAR